MSLCGLAHPKYIVAGKLLFDGKIGIWPIVEEVITVRNSVNYLAGTVWFKNVSVTKKLYLHNMCAKVVHGIKEKVSQVSPYLKNIKV